MHFYFFVFCFPFAGCIGYVQHVGNIQESRSSNLYFDLQLQVSEEETKQIRVMHPRNDGSKRQIFVDKKAAQQPIKLTNLTVSPSGTIIFNQGASIQDVANHVIKFQFVPQQPCQVTKISSVLKSTSGIFFIFNGRERRTYHPTRQIKWFAMVP